MKKISTRIGMKLWIFQPHLWTRFLSRFTMVRSSKVRWIRFSTLAGFPLGRSPSTSPISRRDLYQCCYCNFEKKDFLSKAYNESSIIMEAKTDTPTRCVWYHNFSKKKQTWKLEIYGTNQIVEVCVKSTVLHFVS